jgi:hypothetical protein
MADEKNPVDHLLDLFVFAPLGLLWESRSLYPKLVREGRDQLGPRVQVARMVGQFAVKKGQQEAAKVVHRRRDQSAGEAPPSPPAPVAVRDAHNVVIPLRDDPDEIDGIAESDLAIPSYGSLAASQVVSRLEGLSPVELESVRRYELSHRGRKTVLGKIAHLQATDGGHPATGH